MRTKTVGGQKTGVRVKDEFISVGKINSLMERGQITKGKVELRFSAIDSDGLTGKTAIL